jgi:hypothetical protein
VPENHLITDDETRRIAEAFLEDSPWFGGVAWSQAVIGPGAEYRTDLAGEVDLTSPLGEGQSLSWVVTFVDPSGDEQRLDHESALRGIRELVYGEDDWLKVGKIKQWFTEPTDERRTLKLGAKTSSQICQQALYGKKVFRSPSEAELFGTKLDLFSDQRKPED